MSDQTTVRPFRVEVPEEDLVELRRRIAATRWPSTGSLLTMAVGRGRSAVPP